MPERPGPADVVGQRLAGFPVGDLNDQVAGVLVVDGAVRRGRLVDDELVLATTVSCTSNEQIPVSV